MINNYEIRRVNNEEVLFLFLDNNTEFAKLNSNNKSNLNKEINKYIKDKKINFNGKKVILMAGSLMLGICLLTSPVKNTDNYADYNYTTNIITLNENLDVKDETIKEPIDEIVETTPKENITNETTKEPTTSQNNSNTSSTQSKAPANNKAPTTNTNKAPSSNTETTSPTPAPTTPSIKPTTPPPTTEVVPKQMVTIRRSNGTILNIELEEYLIGVVAAEMPASFNTEALKAGAIAARTYALKAIADGKTLTDTTSTQVYKDNNQLKALWGNSFNTYYNKVKNAVNSTEGLVMYYNNSLINAFYHSTSNGYTENSTAVFGYYPYLVSVESPVDKNVSSYLKTVSFSYENISNKLGIPVTSLSTIDIVRNTSGRVSNITIDTNTYDGVKFRTLLGIRSTDFDITLNENNIEITTRGFGHGVGMSQYGANEYAKQGWTYSQILKHYYTGITINKY